MISVAFAGANAFCLSVCSSTLSVRRPLNTIYLGTDRQVVIRSARAAAVLAAVVAVVMVVAVSFGPRPLTLGLTLSCVAFGILVAASIPSSVALCATLSARIVDDRVEQLVAGLVVSTRPLASLRTVRFRTGVFPIVLEFDDGRRFRALGFPLFAIDSAMQQLHACAPHVRVT
jgi:hypothetical protein